jgi:tyrosine phenol-lyase
LATALFNISGCRVMERGTIFGVREKNGEDVLADRELLRLTFPRRVLTLTQNKLLIDRMNWLFENRKLVGVQVC